MSFEQLMQHAHDIIEKGAALAFKQHGGITIDKFRWALQFVEPLFEPFSRMPDPASYDPLITELTMAMQKLMTQSTPATKLSQDVAFVGTHLDKIQADSDYLQGWDGRGAMAFKTEVLGSFKTRTGNLFTALSTMRGVLQAHQEMWRNARDDIDKIAETTLNALDHADASSDPATLPFVFSVLAAVGTVTAGIITIATGGATAPIVAIGSAASVGSASVAGSKMESGTTCDSIIKSMSQAIDDLTAHIHWVEMGDMTAKIVDINSAISGNKKLFVSDPPKLAGMNDRDLMGDNGMGRLS
ncbi:hypothetical protein ABZ942_42330 [Nocardia sp. NPDC046473]|uniref:hypothetical protein n=1 Tax=Nocardia sp. NPDC046473 TaxID=3155733 RepID=UPI0033F95F80